MVFFFFSSLFLQISQELHVAPVCFCCGSIHPDEECRPNREKSFIGSDTHQSERCPGGDLGGSLLCPRVILLVCGGGGDRKKGPGEHLQAGTAALDRMSFCMSCAGAAWLLHPFLICVTKPCIKSLLSNRFPFAWLDPD